MAKPEGVPFFKEQSNLNTIMTTPQSKIGSEVPIFASSPTRGSEALRAPYPLAKPEFDYVDYLGINMCDKVTERFCSAGYTIDK